MRADEHVVAEREGRAWHAAQQPASERLPVEVAARVLDVSVSGYYAWLTRVPSARSIRHALLTDAIRAVHTASHGIYGARRVHAELTLGQGFTVGHGAVELLLHRAGLRGVTGRPKWVRVKPDTIAKDLVNRAFTRDGPDQLWVTDTRRDTPPGKGRCTGRWSSTPTPGAWSGGPSTRHRPRRWSPTPSAWRSRPDARKQALSYIRTAACKAVSTGRRNTSIAEVYVMATAEWTKKTQRCSRRGAPSVAC